MPPIIFISLCLFLVSAGCGRTSPESTTDRSDLFATSSDALNSSDRQAWTAALQPREFQFPADHAAHEDYQIEWWYYTGHLEADDGSRYGFQLTFFRTGVSRQPDNPSRWTVRDLYTAHFAVSDLQNQQHYCFQRSSRSGIDQAGAATDRYKVWNGDWKVELDGDRHRLIAKEDGLGIELTLRSGKKPILHGDHGLSQKGPMEGNASYYYSCTRLQTEGTVSIDNQVLTVRGCSWMDHEFSTSFLEPNQIGWDWMSIQLDDETELMIYRMRRRDNSKDPFSSGSLITANGERVHLTAEEFRMTPKSNWTSPETGGVYPLRWHVEIPSIRCDLDVRAAFDAQEMTTAETTGISYWEGVIDVKGTMAEDPVSGQGYMELTGYTGVGLGSLFSDEQAPDGRMTP